jgi:hypothetical protein
MAAKDVPRLPRKLPVIFLLDLSGDIPGKGVFDWEKMP